MAKLPSLPSVKYGKSVGTGERVDLHRVCRASPITSPGVKRITYRSALGGCVSKEYRDSLLSVKVIRKSRGGVNTYATSNLTAASVGRLPLSSAVLKWTERLKSNMNIKKFDSTARDILEHTGLSALLDKDLTPASSCEVKTSVHKAKSVFATMRTNQQAELKNLQNQYKGYLKSITEKHDQEFAEKIETHLENHDSHAEELHALRKQLEEANQTITDNKASHEKDLQKIVTQHSAEVQDLKLKLSAAEAHIEKADATIHELRQNYQNDRQTAEQTHANIVSQAESQHQNFTCEVQERLEQQTSQIHSLGGQLTSLHNSNLALQNQVEERNNLIAKLEDSVTTFRESNQELRAHATDLQSRLDNKSTAHADLQVGLNNCKGEAQSYIQKQQQINQQLQDDLIAANQNIDSLTSQLQDKTAKVDELSLQLDTSVHSHAQLQADHESELDHVRAQADSLVQEHDAIVQRLQRKLGEADGQAFDLTVRFETEQETVIRLEQEMLAISKSLQASKQECSRLRSVEDSLRNVYSQLNQASEMRDKLMDECVLLNKTIDEVTILLSHKISKTTIAPADDAMDNLCNIMTLGSGVQAFEGPEGTCKLLRTRVADALEELADVKAKLSDAENVLNDVVINNRRTTEQRSLAVRREHYLARYARHLEDHCHSFARDPPFRDEYRDLFGPFRPLGIVRALLPSQPSHASRQVALRHSSPPLSPYDEDGPLPWEGGSDMVD
ncbi:Hypothetical protein D9617_7g030460 [Elsinoe fawcettii]|nr:Hypothetical protein D9617_7g030460 [Elsinoe fawcettii]